MNKKNIITLVILGIICIIIFLLIFITNKNQDAKSEFTELTLLNDESTFFSVGNNINKLCLYATNNSDKLSFILKEDINKNNYKNLSFKVKEVYVISNGPLYKYYVKGSLYTSITENGNEYVRDEYFILNNDINNRTFNLEIISKEIYDDASDMDYIFEEIEVNEYNRFEYTSLNSKSRAILYFNDFIYKIYFNIEEAYDLLRSDTTEEFESIDQFKNFIKKYNNIQLSEYSVNGNEIGIKDNYNNEYIFNIYNPLKYSVDIIRTEE